MSSTLFTQSSSSEVALEREEEEDEEFLQLVSALPRERGWIGRYIHQYQGFWYATGGLKGVLSLQKHFQAKPGDILLVSYPKSGTTWLKALMFTIVNRKAFRDVENPLHKANPHELVTFLEAYANKNPRDPRPRAPPAAASSPLMMSTHISYTSLPASVKTSDCRIVYVVRDPKDVLVSCWHFIGNIRGEELQPISLAEAFEQFARGASPYGPYWDHVMGYWEASLECPDRILFLSYEDLKEDPCFHARRLAEFLGHSFSPEEEEEGEVSKIVESCSFEKLSNLEVNKSGIHLAYKKVENKTFFRQGKVGDAKNHLSEEMMLILDGITEEKFKNIKIRSSKDESETTSLAAGSLTSAATATTTTVGPTTISTCTTMNAL